jgi:2-hydroxy-3-keto-5-methylthiopentenyl-1-phosphate phosphatase
MNLSGEKIRIIYQNWKGIVGVREIHPIKIWYGSTDFHKEEQWFINAMDDEKKEMRDFAIKDIIKFL